ncbi:MAG: gliding motility-associated ABC transporter substrate-binding protein GldG [Bacteroidota bacterium]
MVALESKKLGDLLQLLIGITAIFLVNILASRNFYRIDLTEEKRFSIKPASKELLRDLDDVVYVEVFLDGELNSGFKRLRNATRETLEEFRIYSGNNIQYTFNDPNVALSENAKGQFMQGLMAKGIQPTNVIDQENGQRIEKLIFPGAIVSYGGVEEGIMLLKGNQAATPEQKLNQSIEGIEYQLASAIRKLTSLERKRIGLLRGHGELDSLQAESFNVALTESYQVDEVRLGSPELRTFDAIIIANPVKRFSEKDKYHLDQYLLHNGNVVLLVDKLNANMDSASLENNFAFPIDINLDDQLFNYGVRINNDLIQDNSAALYPVNVGNMGDQPQIKGLKWWFYPILNRFSDHPITNNLDAVLGRFVSTIDTVKADGVRKTPLLFTSNYSRAVNAPVKVSIPDLRKNLTPKELNQQNLPVAYLLEGQFESLFKNRFKPNDVNETGFKETGNGKLLIVSDGDFIRNEVSPRTGRPQPLGFYPFAQGLPFANQDFMLNSLSYLLDEEGIITARTREVKIRPLNKVKINQEKLKWQVINLALPIFLVILYGLIRYYWRKRKFTGYPTE